ncbi:MAG: hypothetical protein JST68_13765 [Bacteroidetes bacterium]|nr:hypothetical protein [Bacteroidota bacterium]
MLINLVMSRNPYEYNQVAATRYDFVSVGKTRVEKVVVFTLIEDFGAMNLGLGDLLPDGSIDYGRVSDNGDIIKVLATVVDIVKHYTWLHPEAFIYFQGSTNERTKLYGRVLKNYYSSFSESFWVYGAMEEEDGVKFVPFDVTMSGGYLGFLVKRK